MMAIYLHRTRLATQAATEATNAASTNPPGMELDIPIDPNEPTYCFCNQVSFGEMVACDNPDVWHRASDYVSVLLPPASYIHYLVPGRLVVFGISYVLSSSFIVQDRVVPLWLRRTERCAERKMVLFGLRRYEESQERTVMMTMMKSFYPM